VNTTCGASNVGFGIPNRQLMTGHFIAMAAGHGMTSAIMSPLHKEQMDAVRAANVLNGLDPDCAEWLRANRPVAAEGEAPAGARGRRSGRRRRG
jgi:5-methyltetrahydrofolate--homocysteine methyltransferase